MRGLFSLNPFIHQVFFPTGIKYAEPLTEELEEGLNPFIHQVFFPTQVLSASIILKDTAYVSIPLFIRSSFPRTTTMKGGQMKMSSQSLYSSGLLSHAIISGIYSSSIKNVSIPLFIRSSFPPLRPSKAKVEMVICLNPFIHQVFFPTAPLATPCNTKT